MRLRFEIYEAHLFFSLHTTHCKVITMIHNTIRSIGGGGVSPASPPVTGKSFRVVPCVRTCVRAVLGLVRFQRNRPSCSFPFSFYRAGFSLFPFAPPAFPFSLVQAHVPFSLVSTMKKWIQMKSSEFTCNQMKSHDIK